MTVPSWSRARRVLCVRLDTIGDVLMTTPALRALRTPGRRLTLLTSSIGARVGRLIPEVDRVVPYDAPWMKATPMLAGGRRDRQIIERLRGHDAAVIFTVYSQTPHPAALLCHLADIPLRLAHSRENPYQLLSDRVPEPEPERMLRHEVRRQLDLVASIDATTEDERLSLAVPWTARRRVRRLTHGLGRGRTVVLHPGASAPSRRYPWEHFAQAAGRLVRELGCSVVFTGTEPERELVERIRSAMGAPSRSLAGQLGLAELAALISSAVLVVSNNTGPVHVAAAVGTPVVDLYALTNPQHAPWMVPHRLLFHDVSCRNCYSSRCPAGHHACLRLVSPDRVVEAAAELLEAVPPAPPGAGPVIEAPQGPGR